MSDLESTISRLERELQEIKNRYPRRLENDFKEEAPSLFGLNECNERDDRGDRWARYGEDGPAYVHPKTVALLELYRMFPDGLTDAEALVMGGRNLATHGGPCAQLRAYRYIESTSTTRRFVRFDVPKKGHFKVSVLTERGRAFLESREVNK